MATDQSGLLRLMSDVAYDALLIIDESLEIVLMNASARELFDADESGKQSLASVPELEMLVTAVFGEDGEPFEEQLVVRERPHIVRPQVVMLGGNRYCALALHDVTQLLRLNRARRDMVANISHELRTPISNIRLILDSLFEPEKKPKRKHSIAALQAIGRETDSLLWILQEVLDLSMIESGQAILRMVETPLAELVEQAIERVIDQADAKDLTIKCQIKPTLQVLCDLDQARRVLINLIHNAIKWSPDGKTITVLASDGDDVTITILDKGAGVPAEQVERIFERFYQVDTSRSGHEGSGLGLAICKHIVEAHGGRIWVESAEDRHGGCFHFTLPGVAVKESRAEQTIADQKL